MKIEIPMVVDSVALTNTGAARRVYEVAMWSGDRDGKVLDPSLKLTGLEPEIARELGAVIGAFRKVKVTIEVDP